MVLRNSGANPGQHANISLTRVAHSTPDRHPPSRPHPRTTTAHAKNQTRSLDKRLSISAGRAFWIVDDGSTQLRSRPGLRITDII
jgi:hypothetical protein